MVLAVIHHPEADLALAQLLPVLVVVDDDHRLEVGQPLAGLAHLAQVAALGDDGRGPAVEHARHERVLAEGREERLDDGPGLQDAQEPDVELRHLVEEQAHPVERADERVAAQEVRPAVGQLLQVEERELAQFPLVAFVDQGQGVAPPRLHMAVHAEVGDVDRIALAVTELALGQIPGHVAPKLS